MTTLREQFDTLWPHAASAEPLVTALIRSDDIQECANHAPMIWVNRPKIFILQVEVEYGELKNFRAGKTIKVTYDAPGLKEGRYLLILTRQHGLRPGPATLTCIG